MRLLKLGALFILMATLGCAHLGLNYDKPKVAVNSLRVLEPQGLNQRFHIGLTLSNPNAVALPIEGMSYSLKVNGFELLQGVTNEIPKIAAFDETEIGLEASTDLVGALRFLNDFVGNRDRRQLAYNFEAKIKVAGLGQSFVVAREGQLPFINQRDGE